MLSDINMIVNILGVEAVYQVSIKLCRQSGLLTEECRICDIAVKFITWKLQNSLEVLKTLKLKHYYYENIVTL